MTVKTYYELEQKKLLADSDLINLFTRHPGSLGAFREGRLREYLRKHVADCLSISSGFILNHDGKGGTIMGESSKQIDCLIYDGLFFAPLLRTEEFVCVAPGAVAAIIEIKSRLTLHRKFSHDDSPDHDKYPFTYEGKAYQWGGSFVDALTNIKSASQVMLSPGCRYPLKQFTGVFGYDGDGLGKKLNRTTMIELIKQLGINHLSELPQEICVLNLGWWGFSADDLSKGQCEYDSNVAYVNHLPSLDGQTSMPLQWFTAILAHMCRVRIGKEAHEVGGLRSGVGDTTGESSASFPLATTGFGDVTAY